MKMSDDKRLKTKILFQMALIYYDQKKFSDMEKALIEGNNLGQDFPPLLNLLAYHYATEEKNLDEAFKMIEKALQKNKNNPHFLDTQAVVLLKQKSYEQALATFKKCIQLAPDDVHILTNLSKALYQMGDKNGALGALEKAQKLAKHDHEKQECISLLACWKRSEK
jgi:tetratricopeptide (TPR) repeat protein